MDRNKKLNRNELTEKLEKKLSKLIEKKIDKIKKEKRHEKVKVAECLAIITSLAAIGASIGTACYPGIGTAAGAGVGFVVGGGVVAGIKIYEHHLSKQARISKKVQDFLGVDYKVFTKDLAERVTNALSRSCLKNLNEVKYCLGSLRRQYGANRQTVGNY